MRGRSLSLDLPPSVWERNATVRPLPCLDCPPKRSPQYRKGVLMVPPTDPETDPYIASLLRILPEDWLLLAWGTDDG